MRRIKHKGILNSSDVKSTPGETCLGQFMITFYKKGSVYKGHKSQFRDQIFYNIEDKKKSVIRVDKWDDKEEVYDDAFTFLGENDLEDYDSGYYTTFLKVNKDIMFVSYEQPVGFMDVYMHQFELFEDSDDLSELQNFENIYWDFKDDYEQVWTDEYHTKNIDKHILKLTDVLAIDIWDDYCSYAGDGDIYWAYRGRVDYDKVLKSCINTNNHNIEEQKRMETENEAHWRKSEEYY